MTEKKKRGRPKKEAVEKVEEGQNVAVMEKPVEERSVPVQEPKKNSETAKQVVEELLKASQDIDLTKLPLKTVEDYQTYNHEARRQKKPVKFPPLTMFQYVKTKIIRNDGQKNNPLHVRIRDAELMLDYDKELPINQEIEIPYPVLSWINCRAKKCYKEVKYPDGTSETVYSHDEPRFSCQMVM